LFEVGDVALLDSSKDVGARNNRRIGVIHGGTTSGFEIVHGYVVLDIMLRSSLILMCGCSLLDRVMLLCNVAFEGWFQCLVLPSACDHFLCTVVSAEAKQAAGKAAPKHTYALEECKDGAFFPGLGAQITLDVSVGSFVSCFICDDDVLCSSGGAHRRTWRDSS